MRYYVSVRKSVTLCTDDHKMTTRTHALSTSRLGERFYVIVHYKVIYFSYVSFVGHRNEPKFVVNALRYGSSFAVTYFNGIFIYL